MHDQGFSGFPQAGLNFLTELAENNNRSWFEDHKAEYQQFLLQPAQAFVAEIGMELQSISPEIRFDTSANGSGVLMRIYRDVRFSKDKTPYKTSVDGLFWQGTGKKTEHPAFGFRLVDQGMDLVAGMFGFPKPTLESYRGAVLDNDSGPELAKILNDLAGKSDHEVVGEKLKRVPRGFDANHPRADLLKYKGLYVHPARIPASRVISPALIDIVMTCYREMAPLQQWMTKEF